MLVNPVNCVGVAGRGLALEFKKKYPGNFKYYRDLCSTGRVHIGKICSHARIGQKPKYIWNVPTKLDWSKPSKIEYIEKAGKAIATAVGVLGIKSIAIPALGCGCGQLDWTIVKELLIECLKDVDEETEIVLLEPEF